MSAPGMVTGHPVPFQTPGVPLKSVDGRMGLREWIAENLHLVIFEAETAWRCTEIADDVGLRYHLQRLIAHVKQVAQSTNELQTVNDRLPDQNGGSR
jgi:hypothetical protein